MKILRVIIVSVFLLSALASCAPAEPQTQELLPVKMAYFPYGSNSAFFIAVEEGFFAAEGLDLEMVKFTETSDANVALTAGQVDINPAPLSFGTFAMVKDNPGIKVVAINTYVNPKPTCAYDGVFVNENFVNYGDPLPEPSTGKFRVATAEGTFVHYGFDKMMETYGISALDMDVVAMKTGVRGEAVRTGQADFATSSEPFLSKDMALGGLKAWSSYAEVVPNFPTTLIVFGPNITQKNPEIGVRWMRAYMKGVEQFNQGKTDRNLEIIAKYTGSEIDQIKAACLPSITGKLMLDPAAVDDYQAWALKLGLMDETVPADVYWDPQFVQPYQ